MSPVLPPALDTAKPLLMFINMFMSPIFVVGGAANFGMFEGLKEVESQFVHGGHIAGQDEIGRYINEGYSASAVALFSMCLALKPTIMAMLSVHTSIASRLPSIHSGTEKIVPSSIVAPE